MVIVVRLKRLLFIPLLLIVTVCTLLILPTDGYESKIYESIPVSSELTEEYMPVIESFIRIRNKAMLENDIDAIKPIYDTRKRYGIWAYEHEEMKIKHLKNWSEKQGISFTDIKSVFKIRWVKEQSNKISINFSVITEYIYEYENKHDNLNNFRIATYHILDIEKELENHIIIKEWYTDPFADSLNSQSLKIEENKNYILSQEKRDFSALNERRIGAVKYADIYCAASPIEDYFFQYNKNYRNYNPIGGDCTNFASQVLYEGGKFKKSSAWNYYKNDGSRSWVNAQSFKDYLLYSGRASIIVHGTYDKVLKLSYKLLPGDIIAYEKKGKVVHIAVVTGSDSKGYSVVNCHNTDRYRVPWDLGWSDKGIKFWFIHVHY